MQLGLDKTYKIIIIVSEQVNHAHQQERGSMSENTSIGVKRLTKEKAIVLARLLSKERAERGEVGDVKIYEAVDIAISEAIERRAGEGGEGNREGAKGAKEGE